MDGYPAYNPNGNKNDSTDLEPQADLGRPWGIILSPEPQIPTDSSARTNPYVTATQERPFLHSRMSSTSSASQENQNATKVAIPRATHYDTTSRRRSARACEPCRQRKVKCDGNRPICQQCAKYDVMCSYIDVKRVREQKQLKTLTKKVERYEALLRDLEAGVDAGAARQIRRTLRPKVTQEIKQSQAQDDGEESDSSGSSVASLEAIDLVEEDINRNEKSRAAGYFGKNSEVAWMQRLEDEAEHRSRQGDDPFGPEGQGFDEQHQQQQHQSRNDIPIAMMSYHLDDLNIPLVDQADPYDLPPKELADRFFAAYMHSVHPSFNVIRKATFTSQYQKFFSQPSQPPRRWLAILNMVFAIGCRYCRLDNDDFGDGDYNDLVYLTRASKLALRGSVLFEHPDLQQVQVEFLVAFYLLAMGQVNRASKISGVAFRSAISLGINLRFVDGHTHYAAKEARSRLWWSIYALEHLITATTGRVSCVGEGLGSVSAPLPFEEESFHKPEVQSLINDQSLRENRLKSTIFETEQETKSNAEWLATCEPNPSLFFYYTIDLAVITQAVINQVYSIQGLRDRHFQLDQRIQKYSSKLDSWLSKIHTAYRFTSVPNDPTNDQFALPPSLSTMPETQQYIRERVSLAIHYYSARITLCRPCLTHNHSHQPRSNCSSPSATSDHHQSTRSRHRHDMALTCLRYACCLISILPNEPDPTWLIHVSPWWSLLHFLVQATTVCLLGFSNWPSPSTIAPEEQQQQQQQPFLHPPPQLEVSTVVTQTKKALRWLHQMAGADAASRRAFILCNSFMRRIAPSLGIDVDDLPEVESLPPLKGFVDGEVDGEDSIDRAIES
ncbi:hypothetical protein ASPWEDRAFT_42406 [Aspergillus wentii DTO 134E9]|uniref:Zn(2)-C6 fungal-type domain-containing protein n=1 Tax=Aspergillus wentii DTO 134E9 TaxID=1073089 RepID=A0A1L9RHI1_ASPWE|nr:uncharacterized protein ASPWEDRAFT_42406 [Aspergillus wentii DTO 134E9]OJJ34399.1 hypothetical protein ASPWEDRAFT_42406 [Aspergillus wentii DTO 134E9]